ncbi:uncharacterized protein LOC115883611 [Sitophilus oryzae]|uniref:Uncharacterized protein LOC115883611 n=1 Tax=Sitophilus oryzae TaxID=7048 RepID=A0A6J2Y3I2_SITOR|nr:uncharacterized protein LOC115883611 [Sitophilus oryzae]
MAAEINDSRTLYRTTKTLANKNINRECPIVKDKEGNILTSKEDQLHRWTEFFSEPQQVTNDIDEVPTSPTENCKSRIATRAPSIQEIKQALSQLKTGKATGPDNIPAELFKIHPENIAQLLETIIKSSWETEHIPSTWKEGLIVKLPKKGDLSQYKNWRGITLLNTINMTINKIIPTVIQKKEYQMPLNRLWEKNKQVLGLKDHVSTKLILSE